MTKKHCYNKHLNNIITYYIIYIFLLTLPYIFVNTKTYLNGYTVSIGTFFIQFFLIFFNVKIDKKNFIAVYILLLFQITALTLSYNYIDIKNYLLPLTYSFNLITFYILVKDLTLDKKSLIVFYKFIVISGIVFGIYNILKNFITITDVLSNQVNYTCVNISSFFGNRNAYGFFCLLACISTIILIFTNINPSWKYILIFFLINLFLTFSRSSIYSFLIFLSIFYLLKRKDKFILKIVKLFIIILIILALLFLLEKKQIFSDAFIRSDNGLTGRDKIWEKFIEIADINTILFGKGIGLTDIILYESGLNFHGFHNSILDMIFNGGILWISMYIALIVKQIQLYLKLYKNYVTEASIMISIQISMFFYQMFETILVFGIGYFDAYFTLFVYTIPLMYGNFLLKKLKE